ncbi:MULTISPECIES: MogA/MoaB family molybdenum cofactor biosynthesis protein [Streptomyces]|uniref:Molybdenum cofactor biosynthesis protein B n=1 Tax=Streptomyces cremeus TaxID=66881 RepID=A0ABV5PB59_STRCM
MSTRHPASALAPDTPADTEADRHSEAHARPDAVPGPVSEPGYESQVPGEPLHAGPGTRPYRALVVTASNRASAGVYADRGGPLVAEGLTRMGFTVTGPEVVPDGDPVEAALRDGVLFAYDVIVTTGGTGISPTDRTPDATRRVIDYEIPGIPEAIRAEGRPHVPTASLSRGLAGVAGGTTLIVNLPGSTGGVRDGLAVLDRILLHAVDQLRGGDHPGPTGTSGGTN